MEYTLPPLPYGLDDLSPAIGRQTLEFHHGKHHQAYVNNLNNLIKGTRFADSDLETIVKESDGGIFNNGLRMEPYLYFEALPKILRESPRPLAERIGRDFGSFGNLKEAFSKAAATLLAPDGHG